MAKSRASNRRSTASGETSAVKRKPKAADRRNKLLEVASQLLTVAAAIQKELGIEDEYAEDEEESVPVPVTTARKPKKSADDFSIEHDEGVIKTRSSRPRAHKMEFVTIESHRPDLIKKNRKIKKTREEPDRRAPTQLYDVQCHFCGRKEKVSAQLLPPRYDKNDKGNYRCNNCHGGG